MPQGMNELHARTHPIDTYTGRQEKMSVDKLIGSQQAWNRAECVEDDDLLGRRNIEVEVKVVRTKRTIDEETWM